MKGKIKCRDCGYELGVPRKIDAETFKCPKCGCRIFIVKEPIGIGGVYEEPENKLEGNR